MWGWRTWQRVERNREHPIFWAEHELGEEPWTAAYGFVARDDALILAEVRIFPTRDTASERSNNPAERVDRLHLGEWSGDPQLLPRGGLSTRIMRLLRPSEALGEAFNQVWVENEQLRRALAASPAHSHAVSADRKAKRPGKPRRDPALLARAAVLYETALAERRRPNPYIHEKLHGTMYQVALRTVAGLVRDARADGFLTPAAGRGKASGRATEAAHEALRAHDAATSAGRKTR